MHLTLLVPGLLLPAEILETTTYDLNAPTLSRILGCGQRHELHADWLPSAFGLNDLPAAALRKLGAGGTAPGEWLCLDPVRWQVSPEGVTLDDPTRLELDAAESAALSEALRPLFADWGELSASAPGQWELHLERPLALDTQPLPEAIHQPIDPALPAGADGPAWRRLLLEAQTVLHDHPVNRAREAAGRLTANSLWPWGQGRLPARLQTDFSAIWSADALMAGICAFAGIPCRTLPERFAPAEGRLLVLIDSLATPARTLDALAWREALLAFERDWLAPALAAGASLRLVGTRLGWQIAAVAFEFQRADRLRFWRRPLPLTELK